MRLCKVVEAYDIPEPVVQEVLRSMKEAQEKVKIACSGWEEEIDVLFRAIKDTIEKGE